MNFKVKDALAGVGWALAAGAFALGNLTGDAVDPVSEVRDIVASSPAGYECPLNWTRTEGTDPDAGAFVACENDLYIIKALEGGEPIGFEKASGKFVDAESLR